MVLKPQTILFIFFSRALADRPEIKQDVDANATISSGNFSFVETGHIYDSLGSAHWASCSWLTGDQTQGANNLVWMEDSKNDKTFHALGIEQENPFATLSKAACSTKHMTVVAASGNTVTETLKASKGTMAMHTKFMVPTDGQEKTFVALITAMLGDDKRRGKNYLSAATNGATHGHKFEYGFLMLLAEDNVETPPFYRYWHTVQFFGEETLKPPDTPTTKADPYDAFNSGRGASTIVASQWIKLSNSVNPKSVSQVASVPNPSTRVVKEGDDKTKDAARWVSCSHMPVRTENTIAALVREHFVEDNYLDPELVLHPRRPNYHVLQFSADYKDLYTYANCRIQNLDIQGELGNFNLDETDFVMHMEYEVSENGYEALHKAALGLMAKGIADNEFKYMIVLKSRQAWNHKWFLHIYQTFESAENFKTHQDGGVKTDGDYDQDKSLGGFFYQRGEAAKTNPWIKQDSYINGPSPKLTVLR